MLQLAALGSTSTGFEDIYYQKVYNKPDEMFVQCTPWYLLFQKLNLSLGGFQILSPPEIL